MDYVNVGIGSIVPNRTTTTPATHPNFKMEIKDLENDIKQIKDFFEDMKLDLFVIQASEDEEYEYLDEEYEEIKKI